MSIFKSKKSKGISNSRCLLLSFIVLMLFLALLNNVSIGIENPITTLGNGNSDQIITFPKGGGYNNDLNFTLPEGVIITAAEMELRGLGILGTSKKFTHTFQNTINNNAWKGSAKNQPPTSAPSAYQTTVFTNTEYTNIKTSDNIKTTYITKVNNNYPFHLFGFKITETNISSLNVYWEGLGKYNGPSIQAYWAYLYIHNVSSQKWELFGSNSSFFGNIDFIIQNNSFITPSNYINTSNYLHLMAQGPQGFGGTNTADVRTDFVKVETRGTGVSFPTNPTLDIGNDGDIEWQGGGIFDQNVTINDLYNFKTELQSLIDSAPPGSNYVDIPLNFTSIIEGRLKISNISISYEFPEVNLPPFLAQDIPNGTFGFYEDTDGGDNLIDLNDYFWDDRDNGSLIFEILKNNLDIQATLADDGHHLNFTSESNYFGTAEFQVKANDRGLDEMVGVDEDLSTTSNVFTVSVWPTNDGPVLVSIGDITITESMTEISFAGSEGAIEDDWFNLSIIGHDIDGDLLSFSSNLTLTSHSSLEILPDPINVNAAKLSIFPTNELVCEINLSLTISDENDTAVGDPNDPSEGPLTDSISIIIEIKNLNDEPKLAPMDNKTGYEDSWLNFTVSAMDDDLRYGDELTFSTNITTSIDGLIPGVNFEFNEVIGNVSILPDNEMVGSYLVSFIVSDLDGEWDFESMKIFINNVNDPPIALISSPMNNQEWNTSTMLYFDGANSTDDDYIHGDSLSYVWSSNISGIISTEPQFTSNLTAVGWHNITLSVSDESNLESKEYMSIQITAVIIDDKDDDKDKDKDKDNDTTPTDDDKGLEKKDKASDGILLWVLIAILIVIILIITLIFVWLRKKSKGEEQAEVKAKTDAVWPQVGYSQLPVAQPPTVHPLALTSPYTGMPFPPTQQMPMLQPSPIQYIAQPMPQPLLQPPAAEIIEQPAEPVAEPSPEPPEALAPQEATQKQQAPQNQ